MGKELVEVDSHSLESIADTAIDVYDVKALATNAVKGVNYVSIGALAWLSYDTIGEMLSRADQISWCLSAFGQFQFNSIEIAEIWDIASMYVMTAAVYYASGGVLAIIDAVKERAELEDLTGPMYLPTQEPEEQL